MIEDRQMLIHTYIYTNTYIYRYIDTDDIDIDRYRDRGINI